MLAAMVCAGNAAAQTEDAEHQGDMAAARLGSLHRVTATLDATLDVYRLGLVELVPAAQRVRAAGQALDATPNSPIPEAAREVFVRLAASLARRLSSDAMPAIVRAYHAEVLEALTQLELAEDLGSVTGFYQDLIRGMRGVATTALQVVDLYGRDRPLRAHLWTAHTILDEISEALDQLGRAEAAIARARRKGGDLGTQLQAFLKLEMALSHALDLIAAAEEAGIHIGFEVRLPTTSFVRLLGRVQTYLDDLEQTITDMARAPEPIPGDLIATARLQQDGPAVSLSWDLAGEAALLRVERRPSLPAIRASLAATYRCSGQSSKGAKERARRDTEGQEETWQIVEELAPGRTSTTDTTKLAGEWLVSPIYRVVPVSAFGVMGHGPSAQALYLPAEIEAPRLVEARPVAPGPHQREFYENADAVEVTWVPSPHDPLAFAGRLRRAFVDGGPVLRSYRVVRMESDRRVLVAVTPAGVTAFVDRPPLGVLAEGVAYAVEAVDLDGQIGRRDQVCASSRARHEARGLLRLARVGLTAIARPSAWEKGRAQKLVEPDRLRTAVADFRKRPQSEQERLLRTWWQDTPEVRRNRWLRQWRALSSQEDGWAPSGLEALSLRDQPWALAEIWLSSQPPQLHAEVDRWWTLVDGHARQLGVDAWSRRLNRLHRAWVQSRLRGGDQAVLRPARLLAWWYDRDPIELEEVHAWWQALAPDVQVEHLGDWAGGLAKPAREAARWPDWATRSTAERQALQQEGYRKLPVGLWPLALAWVEWEELALADKERAVLSEAGATAGLLSALRYRLRPVDKALGFHGVAAVLTSICGTFVAFLGARRRRK